MSYLNLDGSSGSDHIVEKLTQERKHRSAKSVGFEDVEVNEAILHAALLLFRDRQQQHNFMARRISPLSMTSDINSNIDNDNDSDSAEQDEMPNPVKLEKLSISNCPVNRFLDYLIEAAMGMDLFKEFELEGPPEELPEGEGGGDTSDGRPGDDDEEDDDDENESPPTSDIFDLDALGFKMRFSRRLRKLELINIPITRDNAYSLMYGIETNADIGTGCRLHELLMEGVRFVEEEGQHEDDMEEEMVCDEGVLENSDDNHNLEVDNEEGRAIPGDGTVVVKELHDGFQKNRTLRTIEMQRCGLTDAQIALILDSLAFHPTLTSINLSENVCRNLGMEALDRILIEPDWMIKKKKDQSVHYCRIESLDLSYQFTSEETYGTEEHIQLGILTRNCTTKDADMRIYPYLRKLVLQGNQIDNTDMEDLAFLVRHRFPGLEELDLRFNDITTEGLEAFANHSDPNNAKSYMTTNNGNDTINTDLDAKGYKDHFPPPNSRLRTIRLTNNPLVMTNHTLIVILKLLKIYPELTQIQSNLEWEGTTPIAQYIQHIFDINRSGRVLLLADNNGIEFNEIAKRARDSDEHKGKGLSRQLQKPGVSLPVAEELRRRQLSMQLHRPIPMAAWALVLARLTRSTRYPQHIPEKNSLNGLYYLIRHGPIIQEASMEKSMTWVNKRKNISSKRNKTIFDSNDDQDWNQDWKRMRMRGDPALGGYTSLAEFLRCELGE